MNHVARWDGAAWSALGGTSAGVDGIVHSLAVHDDGTGEALYVGGAFSTAGGLAISNLARWRGSSWSSVGSAGPGSWNGVVLATAFLDAGAGGRLVAGGHFDVAGGAVADNLAAWDGASWAPLAVGQGLAGQNGSWGVVALHVHDDGSGPALYAGGDFERAGSVATPGIARWSGQAWQPVGVTVPPGPFFAMTLCTYDDGSGPKLYAGDHDRIWSWDGIAWSVENVWIHGMTGALRAMVVHDDGSGSALYVAGPFTDGCLSGAHSILRWDGVQCSDVVGTGLSPGFVSALAVFDDGGGPALYAGGAFYASNAAYEVARWDGLGWSAVGGAFDDVVKALAVYDDGNGAALYAGGDFSVIGHTRAHGIAKWNGQAWSALGPVGPSVGSQVNALTVYDDGSGLPPALVAAGSFSVLGSTPVQNIARWDGAHWSPIGAGIVADGYYTHIWTLASFDDGSGEALFVGGDFVTAGGVGSHWIAKVEEACGSAGSIYCTAKTNSQGCASAMVSTGNCELGTPEPFVLSATNVLNNKLGFLFYGTAGAWSAPFQGGRLCVKQPLTRTPVQSSGGNGPPDDCSGSFAFEFEAWISSGVDPRLVPGAKVNAQYWHRDPSAPYGAGLSDAVAFAIAP